MLGFISKNWVFISPNMHGSKTKLRCLFLRLSIKIYWNCSKYKSKALLKYLPEQSRANTMKTLKFSIVKKRARENEMLHERRKGRRKGRNECGEKSIMESGSFSVHYDVVGGGGRKHEWKGRELERANIALHLFIVEKRNQTANLGVGQSTVCCCSFPYKHSLLGKMGLRWWMQFRTRRFVV